MQVGLGAGVVLEWSVFTLFGVGSLVVGGFSAVRGMMIRLIGVKFCSSLGDAVAVKIQASFAAVCSLCVKTVC